MENSILSGAQLYRKAKMRQDELIISRRLPVASLYLDIFQKIKAMGYNGVSFYVHWALLEGKPGEFNANGVFALEPFFDAASKAGIYLLAVS